jgi:hypothetical protein
MHTCLIDSDRTYYILLVITCISLFLCNHILVETSQSSFYSSYQPPSSAVTLNKVTSLNILQYAAFFGDCEHKVEPVLFGTRLTLAFTLRRVDGEGKQTIPPTILSADEQAMLHRARNFYHKLSSYLRNYEFMSGGGTIGFACVHLYEDQQLPPVEQALPSNITARNLNLKGADALICIAAAHLNLDVQVVRLVTENCTGTRWSVKKIPDLPLIKRFGTMGYWSDAGCRARLIDDEGVQAGLGGTTDIVFVNTLMSMMYDYPLLTLYNHSFTTLLLV